MKGKGEDTKKEKEKGEGGNKREKSAECRKEL